MLTTTEETWVKNQVKTKDFEKEIETITQTAFDTTQIKLAEVQAVEDKRVADVKVIQDQIDLLTQGK